MKAWPFVRLSEVLQVADRSVPVDQLAEVNVAGVYSFGRGLFKRGPLTPSETSYRHFNRLVTDDFVISQPKAWEGALARVSADFDGWYLSPVFPAFCTDANRLLPHWLEWYCKRSDVWFELRQLAKGIGARRETVSPEQFLSLEITLPPLLEQKRLVARIDALAVEIARAAHIGRTAADEAEALTYCALRSVRDGLLRRHEETHAIGDVFKVTAGGTPARDNPAFWDGDIPWLKTGELLDRDITTAEERITDAAIADSAAKVFPRDTVLIALYGQGQTRGRTGRLRIAAATNQACCALLPVPNRADARYVQYWLRTWYHDLREEAQGGAQPNWNGAMIKRLPIVLPSLAEQHRIVAELDALQAEVDALKAAQAVSRAELDALLPAVLDRAFAGAL